MSEQATKFDGDALREKVAADMRPIFADAPHVRREASPRREIAGRRPAAQIPAARAGQPSPGPRRASVGLIAAAAFVGVAAGAVLSKPPALVEMFRAAGTRAAVRPMSVVAPIRVAEPPAPKPPPVAPAIAAAALGPPAPDPTPAPEAKPLAAAPVPAAPKPRPAAAPRPAVVPVASAGSRCERDEDDVEGCLYGEVLAADRRLRRAYESAIRDGTPYEVLQAYRRVWVKARQDAARDPRGVVRRYEALAAGLGAGAPAPRTIALR